MEKLTPMRGLRPLSALGLVVVLVLVAVLGGPLVAAEPGARTRIPRRPVPPRGPFSGVPAVPSPFPNPFPVLPPFPVPPALSDFTTTSPTDRCLVVAPSIDPGAIQVAGSIDPGIFAEPRVRGVAIRTPGWRLGR